jgi:hypothetical protein
VRSLDLRRRPAVDRIRLEDAPGHYGYQYEIWHGQLLRITRPGARHGECETRLAAALAQATRGLGQVYTGDTGFLASVQRGVDGHHAILASRHHSTGQLPRP